jgi:23S rRNA (cytidine1920-2'-O)/16S rRNA (cytidine1409-2'-O)-methyltransferase
VSTARLDVELVRRGLARARGQAEEMVRAGRVSVDGRPAGKPALQVASTASIEVAAGGDPDWVGRGARKLDGVLDDLAASGRSDENAGELTGERTDGRKDERTDENAGERTGERTDGRTDERTGERTDEGPGSAGLHVRGRRCLDAGASTGGFTQVLLDRGAREVVAVDVGTGQLAEVLREDARVVDRPGTSVRGLAPDDVGGPVDLLVADLSFISLQVVLADLVRLVHPGGDLLLLVKPQFEVGRRRLGSGGVVRSPALRAEAVQAVAEAALDLGLVVRAVRASRWPGPSGNVEYFVWLTLPSPPSVVDGTVVTRTRAVADSPAALAAVVRAAVEEGPA